MSDQSLLKLKHVIRSIYHNPNLITDPSIISDLQRILVSVNNYDLMHVPDRVFTYSFKYLYYRGVPMSSNHIRYYLPKSYTIPDSEYSTLLTTQIFTAVS